MPPGVVPVRTRKTPVVTVARYVAIGMPLCHRKVCQRPCRVTLPTSSPLAIAVVPTGTVTRKS
jgi:hypothetical protein